MSKKNFEFEGIELCNSTSDYFLAWNQFTKDEAVKAGLDEKKIVILGIPKYINSKLCDYKINSTKPKRSFGIVLNAKSFDNLNRELIAIADKISEKMGYTYVLKYHPQFKDYVYDKIPQSKLFIGHVDLDTTVPDYISKVDFTLISNSTVFLELVFLDHHVYRMIAGEEDKFRDVSFNSFSSVEELENLLTRESKESEKNSLNICVLQGIQKCTIQPFLNPLNSGISTHSFSD